MKRAFFRVFVLGAIAGVGMLAIAHAQRPATSAQDEPPANPLRPVPEQGDSAAFAEQRAAMGFPAYPPRTGTVPGPPLDYRSDGLGPVDTAPSADNPLRQLPPRSSPLSQKPPSQAQTGPLRIQLVADEEPADSRNRASGGSTSATIKGPLGPLAAGFPSAKGAGVSPAEHAAETAVPQSNGSGLLNEPHLMPAQDDRYATPTRASAPEPSLGPMGMPAGRTVERGFHEPDGPGDPSHASPKPEGLAGASFAPPKSGELAGSSFSSQKPDSPEGPSLSAREEFGQAAAGKGQPGDKQLEGPQNARVTLQKIAPPEIQVGRPAVLRTVVCNSGPAAAADVEVRDQIPRGTRLLGTTPAASRGPSGELVWSVGTLKPDAEATVEMQIVPTDEGEVGSVASVRYQTAATARSIVTRPKLAVQTSGPQRVLSGDDALLSFTVSNPGSGVATGVTLLEHIPAGLKHPAGPELEYNVGDLKPGESRQLQLRLKAVEAGTINNVISARADGSLRAEHRYTFEVASAKLDVALNGPTRRYLKREATYQFSVANPGTAPAKQVELVAYLPPGLQFVSANNYGHYDANERAVYWQIDELPVNKPGTVELVTLAVAQGQFNLKVRGTAQRGLVSEKQQPVIVDGLAAVLFQLSHTKDPLEIGGETTYEISVVNQGSKASTNLQVSVVLPPELRPLAGDGPTRYTIRDNKVTFESLPQLAPKSVAAFRVRAQGLRAGDLRVRCQLTTDEMQQPVVKEESTRVYADE